MSKTSVAIRSQDDIATAINAFTDAQWARLRKMAEKYRYAMEPDDLLQEAFKRALEPDGRNCPTNVDVVWFLVEAMRSIANGESEKAKGRPKLTPIANHGGSNDNTEELPDDSIISAEDWLAREQEAGNTRRKILTLFDDDPAARDIVEGRIADLTADELRELTGLNETAYASKLRLIRRRIEQKYPKGWAL